MTDEREARIMEYQHLIRATRARRFPELPEDVREDVEQAGQIGLIRAIDRYDEGNGARFETYAIACIYGEMRAALRAQDATPRPVREAQAKVGRGNVSAGVLTLAGRADPESLDLLLAAGTEFPAGDDLAIQVIQREQGRLLARARALLTAEEWQVIEGRWVTGRSLRQLAREMRKPAAFLAEVERRARRRLCGSLSHSRGMFVSEGEKLCKPKGAVRRKRFEVRLQVVLDRARDERLGRLAHEAGVSKSERLRQLIDAAGDGG